MRPAIQPIVRLLLTFVIVWFYVGLTSGWVSGVLQVVVVVALSIPTWVVLGRLVLPAER